jgi:monoterpene epsilon-lactone hydrolase
VRAQKGVRWSIEARKPYDALLESVPAPDDVTFKPGTVGDVSGVWVYSASSRPDQAILHFHGGWFHAGSATAYRHLVGHTAARAATRAFVPERLGDVAQILFDHAGASGTVLAWELTIEAMPA